MHIHFVKKNCIFSKGKEYKEHKLGLILFYIYNNGKVEKKLIPQTS